MTFSLNERVKYKSTTQVARIVGRNFIATDQRKLDEYGHGPQITEYTLQIEGGTRAILFAYEDEIEAYP